MLLETNGQVLGHPEQKIYPASLVRKPHWAMLLPTSRCGLSSRRVRRELKLATQYRSYNCSPGSSNSEVKSFRFAQEGHKNDLVAHAQCGNE